MELMNNFHIQFKQKLHRNQNGNGKNFVYQLTIGLLLFNQHAL